MSKVYSFRLDENNLREAQAREVIESWVSEGYSLRQIITNALIQNSDNGNQSEEINALLEQLRGLIDQRTNRLEFWSNEGDDTEKLPSSFIQGIRKSMKSGVAAE